MNIVHEVLAARKDAPLPKVGDGATILMWSDRHPATVTDVKTFKSGKRIGELSEVTVRRDIATTISGSPHDGSAKYEYTPDPDGPVSVYRTNKYGQLVSSGGIRLRVGSREKYYDPHF